MGGGDQTISESSCSNNNLTSFFVLLKIIKHKRIHEESVFRKKRLSDLKLSLSLPCIPWDAGYSQSTFKCMEQCLLTEGCKSHCWLKTTSSHPPTPPQCSPRLERTCQRDKISLEIKPYSSHQLPFHKGARAMPQEKAALQPTAPGHWMST